MRKVLAILSCTALLFGCSPSKRGVQSPAGGRNPMAPNAVAAGTGSISGVVTDATNNNAPVAGVLVTAFQFTIPFPGIIQPAPWIAHSAITDNSGAYTLTGCEDGSYLVMCRPALTHLTDGTNASYPDRPIYPQYTTLVPQWHDGSELTNTNGTNAAMAGGVVISGGNAVSQVNFPLHRNAAEASGDMRFEFSHGPAVGMHIQASTSIGVGLPLTIVASVCLTDATGHFRIAGLPNSGEVSEEDIEMPDPVLPGMDQRTVHLNQVYFRGNQMVSGIQGELRPWVFGADQSYIAIAGAEADDPEGDATLGAADVTHVSVSQGMGGQPIHITGCTGWSAAGHHEIRVDVTSREPISTQSKYRLRVLLTDNLALSYQEKVIQTMLLDDSGELSGNSSNAGDTPIHGWPVSQVGSDDGPNPASIYDKGNFWKTYGFHTTGPALATDPDPLGDLANPGVSTISWMFNLASLGPLKGSGTAFYIVVETIGVKGGGGFADVAQNEANPKTAKPILVKILPQDFQVGFCGKIGVI